jgi:hypothetical protein
MAEADAERLTIRIKALVAALMAQCELAGSDWLCVIGLTVVRQLCYKITQLLSQGVLRLGGET